MGEFLGVGSQRPITLWPCHTPLSHSDTQMGICPSWGLKVPKIKSPLLDTLLYLPLEL